MGSPHPIAWYQDAGAGVSGLSTGAPAAGRSFYTSLGHLNSTWQDETFISHVMNGLLWALDGKTTRAYDASALIGNPGNSSTTASATGSVSATTSGTGR